MKHPSDKIAVFSDIHGNLEALQAVLTHAKAHDCSRFACLGDVVGYGANPNECVETVRDLNCPVVMGNHDQACTAAPSNPNFNFNWMAAAAVDWTRKQLKAENADWLRNLKYTKVVESFIIVHASLGNPEMWDYVLDRYMAKRSLDCQHVAVCFHGHTHIPVAFIRKANDEVKSGIYTKLKIELGCKYFVNVGSVGQPRDRNPQASYVIFDLAKNSIELQRLDYDIKTAQTKILASELPPAVAERLSERLGQGQ